MANEMIWMMTTRVRQRRMSGSPSTTTLRPPPQGEMKGIICGNRCDDGEHDNQPCDADDAATTTTTTKKSTTSLTLAMTMTMTTAVTTTTGAAATTMTAI